MVYNGKPYEQMDDLGVFPLFLETPNWHDLQKGFFKVLWMVPSSTSTSPVSGLHQVVLGPVVLGSLPVGDRLDRPLLYLPLKLASDWITKKTGNRHGSNSFTLSPIIMVQWKMAMFER